MQAPTSKLRYWRLYLTILVLLIVMFGSVTMVLFLALNTNPECYEPNKKHPRLQRSTEKSNLRVPFVKNIDKFLVKMGKTIKKLSPCQRHPLLVSNKSYIWIQRDNLPHYNLSTTDSINCCYRSFHRQKHAVYDGEDFDISDRVQYSPCRFFRNIIQVKDEFVKVNCDLKIQGLDHYFLFAREKIISVKPKNDIPYNVLILGISKVSRLNLHRTMPKTVKFLKDLGAVELLRYNKVTYETFSNFIPFLAGINEEELQETCWPSNRVTFDDCPFIWKPFQRAGFATALAEDCPRLGMFHYDKYDKKLGFNETPTDYYLHTFMKEAEKNAGNNGDRSLLCINDKYFFQVLLDYVQDLTTSSKHKLFGIFWETSMSHRYLNYPVAMDDGYTALFKNMQSSGYLNETIIFLISDQGKRWGTLQETHQGFLEERLPFVFALMPPSFREDYSEAYRNLKQNVWRLATPYDMHATLSDLINLDSINNSSIVSRTNELHLGQKGISLFLPISKDRTCESARIDTDCCVDYESLQL